MNESVWEHLKLLYWPMLAAALVLARGPRRHCRRAGFSRPSCCSRSSCWRSITACARSACRGLPVDLTLYVLTMAGGFLLAARLSRSGPARRLTGVSLLAVMLYGAALVLFTFAAPPLGIFQP